MGKLNRADLVASYEAGESIEKIARVVGVTYAAVRWHLVKAGVRMRSSAGLTDAAIEAKAGKPIAVCLDEMANLYRDGVSPFEIGQRYGITKPAVLKRLREQHVEFRSRSESATVKMAKLTDEARHQVTEAAHSAVRGVPRTFQQKLRGARTRQASGLLGSELEREMEGMLRAGGLSPVMQRAIGPYNVDLALEETSIAVEVFGGHWHNHGKTAEAYPQRVKYLIDAGWHVVVIWAVHHARLGQGAADYVIALDQCVRRGESELRQEWVIWGDGRLKPVSKTDPRNRTVI